MTTSSGSGRSKKKLFLGLFGVLILVAGVVAGVILVKRQQDIRSNAGTDCTGIDNPDVHSPISIPEGCTVNGTRYYGDAPSGTTDCVGYHDNGSSVSYTGPYTINLNPSCGKCEQVDFQVNGTSYGTAKYGGDCAPYKQGKVCGETCSKDSDCISESSSGVAITCRNGICENANCSPGKTEPGTICQCLDKGVCGSPCGPKGTLCTGEEGITCGFLNPPNQCAEKGGIQYCLPKQPNNGYTISRCTNDKGLWHLEGPNGETGSQLTVDDVLKACAPQATEQPTAAPIATQAPQIISAQCINVHVYDTDWNELTTADMQNLKPGDTIRVAVAGSSSSGSFTKARFTINGTLRDEVTSKVSATNEFYDEYTIPEGATGLNISAEVFHSQLGWF